MVRMHGRISRALRKRFVTPPFQRKPDDDDVEDNNAHHTQTPCDDDFAIPCDMVESNARNASLCVCERTMEIIN